MLDTCSTSSFCSKRLADQLGIKGIPIQYELSTLNNTLKQESYIIPTLYVESTEGSLFTLRNVYVIDNIPACTSQVDTSEYEYLVGVNVVTSSVVDLLIGQDNAEALVPLEVKKGAKDEPFAVRTVLGWSLHGRTGSHTSDLCGLVKSGKVSQSSVKLHSI